MRSVSGVGRIAAIGAVVIAVLLVGYLLLASSAYKVTAEFENAGQLVQGNPVQIGGVSIGKVTNIEIAPNGHVFVEMTLKGPQTPLKSGTKAQIKQLSLSSIAGRYIELEQPSAPADQRRKTEIPEGGKIPISQTITAVDLDQVFNTLDPVARVAIQDFIKGSATQWEGKGEEANRGLQYLNPSLSTTRRLFNELGSDKELLRRFVSDSADFMNAVAQRRQDLSGVVANLNTTTRALANEKAALREAIGRFPTFMRSANTTFVNLRSTLDGLDPLVDASKPVAPKLERLLEDLRPFARDARPTVRDLDDIVRRPGSANDLVELDRTFPPLASIALDTKRRSVDPGRRNVSVGRVRGAFPEMTEALTESITGTDGRGGQLGAIPTFRPYTPDLFSWFDDFSTSGPGNDALGGFSRTQVYVNFLDRVGLTSQLTPALAAQVTAILNSRLSPVLGRPAVPSDLGPGFGSLLNGITDPINDESGSFDNDTKEYKRCPGASEERASDGSNVFSSSEQAALDCDESDRATGAGN